jgi:hypothetical protein
VIAERHETLGRRSGLTPSKPDATVASRRGRGTNVWTDTRGHSDIDSGCGHYRFTEHRRSQWNGRGAAAVPCTAAPASSLCRGLAFGSLSVFAWLASFGCQGTQRELPASATLASQPGAPTTVLSDAGGAASGSPADPSAVPGAIGAPPALAEGSSMGVPLESGMSSSGNAAPQSGDIGAVSDAGSAAAPSALGQACAVAADCTSGFCAAGADGVSRCCETACDGACQRCSATGSCDALPKFASECAEVTCPADDVCRDYEQSIAAGSCKAAGQCANAPDCTFQWTTVARGGDACQCDDTGCKLKQGEPCTRADDCAGAACSPTQAGASVCCAQSCAANEICRADGSGCDLAPVCTDG